MTYAERRSVTCLLCRAINERDSEGRGSCWKCGSSLYVEGNELGLTSEEALTKAREFDQRLTDLIESFDRG